MTAIASPVTSISANCTTTYSIMPARVFPHVIRPCLVSGCLRAIFGNQEEDYWEADALNNGNLVILPAWYSGFYAYIDRSSIGFSTLSKIATSPIQLKHFDPSIDIQPPICPRQLRSSLPEE